MRTKRREHDRERRSRREADRTARREASEAAEVAVADPPRTVDDLLDVLAEGRGLTYDEAALVGGLEEAVGGLTADGDGRSTGGW